MKLANPIRTYFLRRYVLALDRAPGLIRRISYKDPFDEAFFHTWWIVGIGTMGCVSAVMMALLERSSAFARWWGANQQGFLVGLAIGLTALTHLVVRWVASGCPNLPEQAVAYRHPHLRRLIIIQFEVVLVASVAAPFVAKWVFSS
ncbi:MAG: hypothetical protein ACK2T0_12515 [Anaerolineales bacterium]